MSDRFEGEGKGEKNNSVMLVVAYERIALCLILDTVLGQGILIPVTIVSVIERKVKRTKLWHIQD